MELVTRDYFQGPLPLRAFEIAARRCLERAVPATSEMIATSEAGRMQTADASSSASSRAAADSDAAADADGDDRPHQPAQLLAYGAPLVQFVLRHASRHGLWSGRLPDNVRPPAQTPPVEVSPSFVQSVLRLIMPKQ